MNNLNTQRSKEEQINYERKAFIILFFIKENKGDCSNDFHQRLYSSIKKHLFYIAKNNNDFKRNTGLVLNWYIKDCFLNSLSAFRYSICKTKEEFELVEQVERLFEKLYEEDYKRVKRAEMHDFM